LNSELCTCTFLPALTNAGRPPTLLSMRVRQAPFRLLLFFSCLAFFFCPACKKDDDTPAVDRQRTSAKLKSFSSCDTLEEALKANLKEEMRICLLSASSMRFYYSPEGGTTADGGAPQAENGHEKGVDYSGTNNQEQGVDEADFIKTDGYTIYALNGNELVLLAVPEYGLLESAGTVKLEGYPGEMLLSKAAGGRAHTAVVFSTVSTWDMPKDHPLYGLLAEGGTDEDTLYNPSYRCSELTKLTFIDLADPSLPEVVREVYIEGYYQTARSIDASLHLITYAVMDIPGLQYWPDLPDDYYAGDNDTRRERLWDEAVAKAITANDTLIDSLPLEDFVPRVYEVADGETASVLDVAAAGCSNFTMADDGASRGFTSILSLDLHDASFAIDADHIVSNWSTVYASTDTLLIAEPAQDWWWYWGNEQYDEATNIHCFALSPDGTAQYTGSGRIDGTVQNQFSLSEYDGYLRVAATTGQWNRWWLATPAPPETNVYVLQQADNSTLETLGHIGGIAQGEQIWSARFIGTRGYLVTFKNMDPLWTVDLSDPRNPAIAGKLDVPGVSTYIHPVSDTRLLTIGYGGDESGLDWTIEVSLFDVADFSAPRLIDSLSLSPGGDNGTAAWGWSEAVYEHRAFQYWEPKKLLAVPVSSYRYTYTNDYDYYYEYSSRLTVVDVDNETGFTIRGRIDHSPFYNSDASVYWCSQDIRRSIFMGDFLYAISDRGVTASRSDSLEETAAVNLQGTNCGGVVVQGVDF